MDIDVSSEAYSNLYTLLKQHNEYNCVRFSHLSSCCKNATVDVILDEVAPNDSINKIKDIDFVYSKDLEEKIKSINLIYRDSNFLIKCEPLVQNKSCSNCGNNKSDCSSCNGCNFKK